MYLSDNVYWVEGAVCSVLYDFNTNSLYHLNKEASGLVRRSLTNPSVFSIDENAFLNKLVNNRLLSFTPVPLHDINTLIHSPKIDFVWIEVTTKCNLRCKHCYDDSDVFCDSVMSYPDFCHIIDEIQNNDIRKIQIIGGEPLVLGYDLMRYLDYCKGKFDYIEIFTNGTLLDETWIGYFSRNNIQIALSVYSYLPDQHDRVTGKQGSWRKTNEGIEKLRDAGISYRVKNVIMSDLILGERSTNLYELSTRKDIVRLTGRASISLMNKELIRRKLITRHTFTNRVKKNEIVRNVSGHNCFSRRLYFATDSVVYPCVMERRISHGSIKDKHLSEIIDNSLLKLKKDKIEECKECEFRYSCFDCRPDSNGGDITQKPWYCTYLPKLGIWQDPDIFIDNILKT